MSSAACEVTEGGVVPFISNFKLDPLPEDDIEGGDGEIDWLVEGLVARGWRTALVGPPKGGKSTLLSQILIATSEGGNVINRDVKQCKVCVLSEEPLGVWHWRRNEMGLGWNVKTITQPENLPGQSLQQTEEGWREIANLLADDVKRGGWDLVIIDTLSAFWPVANENDASHQREALKELDRIKQAGAAVLVVHHSSKVTMNAPAGQASRGSNALIAWADVYSEFIAFTPNSDTDPRRSLCIKARQVGITKEVLTFEDGAYHHLGDYDEEKAKGKRKGVSAVGGKSRAAAGDDDMRQKIISAMHKNPIGGGTFSGVCKEVKGNRSGVYGRVWNEMVSSGQLIACDVTGGNKQDYRGYRLADELAGI